MPLPMAFVAALALGQVTVTFRDGDLPTPAYAGTRDVSVWDGTTAPWLPDTNYNGFSDQVGGGADLYSTLMKFDLSSVPPSTVISGASVQLYYWGTGWGLPFPAYQCLRPWTASGATWNRYDGTNPWAVPGAQGAADRGAVPEVVLSTTTSGFNTFSFTDAGVALVQSWISGAVANDGLVIQDYAQDGGIGFSDFQAFNVGQRPQISLALADGGGITIAGAGSDTVLANARDPTTTNCNGCALNADGSPKAALLISWDVSAIPPWSTVSAAQLVMDCGGDGTAQPYSLYESLRPWVEMEASWNSSATGAPWAAPGANGPGDHGTTVLGILTGQASPLVTPLNDAGVQVVQSWVRGGPNHGLEAVEYALGGDGIWCSDREEPNPSLRPALRLTYVEGQLSFTGPPAAGGLGAPIGPFRLERRQLDGTPISAGAPALMLAVLSSNTSAGFAGDPAAVSWPRSFSTSIPAGSSVSDPFWMEDSFANQPTLTILGGAPWLQAQQTESVQDVRLSITRSTTAAGGSLDVTVQAFDSADLTGPAAISARLPAGTGATFSAATVGTPGGTQVSGVAPAGSATFTVQDNRAEVIPFCASITSSPVERCADLVYAPGAPDHLRLSLARAGASTPIAGCAEETLAVQLMDRLDNPVGQASQASICADATSGLVLGASTLAGESRAGGCVSGALSVNGGATLAVSPSTPVAVTFSASSPDVPSGGATLPVQWIAGPPSLRLTGLAPRDGVEPMVIKEGAPPSYVRLTPRDDCGFVPLTSPINVAIPPPMAAGTPVTDADAGVVDIPVSMSACPAVLGPRYVRVTVFGQPLVEADGGVRELRVDPQCDQRVERVGCGCQSGPAALGTAAALLALLGLRRRRSPAPSWRSSPSGLRGTPSNGPRSGRRG